MCSLDSFAVQYDYSNSKDYTVQERELYKLL